MATRDSLALRVSLGRGLFERIEWPEGSVMATASGRPFDLEVPDAATVELVDVAHALALQCRFRGHCRHHYSVGQHSLLVSRLLAAEGPELEFAGLLHDSPEVYSGDQIQPDHRNRTAGHKDRDALILGAVCIALEVPLGMRDRFDSPLLHRADDEALVAEARDLLPASILWCNTAAVPHIGLIQRLVPESVEAEWLEQFYRLRRIVHAMHSEPALP